MRRRLLVATVASIVAISALLTALILPSLLAPTSVSLPYKAGDVGSYAAGSSTCVVFTLQHAGVITGSFVTNSSATANIFSDPQGKITCQNLNGDVYSTGNVNQATLSVQLPAGTYALIFMFTNETTVQTGFNITQSFVATYQQ